jgi:hypothetical protein
VVLPPGRDRLAMKPARTGSPTPAMTMGILEVARRARRFSADRDDDIDLVLDQVAGQLIETIAHAIGISVLKADVLVLHPAVLAQPFPHSDVRRSVESIPAVPRKSRATVGGPACWPWTASGAARKLTPRTTVSRIRRTGTSGGGWLAGV